jgi:hypothetical protein
VLQNRVSVQEWAQALGELNDIVHRYGPNPMLWSIVSILALLPVRGGWLVELVMIWALFYFGIPR